MINRLLLKSITELNTRFPKVLTTTTNVMIGFGVAK